MDKFSNSLISCSINDKVYFVTKGSTILQACEEVGLIIPRFCYHDKLSIAGNCRMCLVQLDKAAKPVASCALEVSAGMKIYTNTALVKRAREGVMEFLLANHPLDCPICDQGGECDLQDQALVFGNDRGRFYEIKRAVVDKDWGHLIKTVMTRCIHCTRCQRFSSELSGRSEIAMVGRGSKSEITNFLNNFLLSEVSGNVIDLCPVGALTSKPYAFTARPWELSHVEHIDLSDSMGSNLSLHIAGQRVFRILPVVNAHLNEEWLSDRARFSYDGFRLQRVLSSFVLNGDKAVQPVWSEVLQSLFFAFGPFIPSSLIIGEISVEDGYALSSFVTFSSHPQKYYDRRNAFCFNTSYSTFAKSDLCILIGTPLKADLPLLLLRLRFEQVRRPLTILSLGVQDLGLGNINIGSTFYHFLSFLRGSHPLSPRFKRARNPKILISNLLTQFSNLLSITQLINQLALLGNKECVLSVLTSSSTNSTSTAEFGLSPFSSVNQGSKTLLLVNSINQVKTNLRHDQGHIFTSYGGFDADKSSISYVYPVPTVLETVGHYLNGQNRLQLGRRVFLNKLQFCIFKFFTTFKELLISQHRVLSSLFSFKLNEPAPALVTIALPVSVYNCVNIPTFTINGSSYISSPVTHVSPLLNRSVEVEKTGLIYTFPA